MRTSQINPQIAINALMGYLGTYNYYYSWYNFIHNTYDSNFTGYVPDEEYFTFNRLQDEPMADTSMAEDTYIFDGVTFYIFED